jgi:DNA-binding response OmpR family regulator
MPTSSNHQKSITVETAGANPRPGALKVLIVEDEKVFARSIERQLQREGYFTEVAFDGEHALDAVRSNAYNLILLDLKLAKKSGLDVLKELRSNSQRVPVIIISAKDTVQDRILGLNAGADDYLVKPFDSGELSARMRAVLHRTGKLDSNILQAGDLRLDVIRRKVFRQEREIALSNKEFALLEFLLRNKNQIVTRTRIALEVWGYTFEPGTKIVDVTMSNLRKAVDESFDPKLIQTIYREGYLLAEKSGELAKTV